MSEVSWIYSVLFYAGTLVLVHVMTATKRTADARFPLLMLFTLNAIVERLVCNFRSVKSRILISLNYLISSTWGCTTYP